MHLLINFLTELPLRPNAYLDPGSGSFILQLIIAGALGFGLALRNYWGRITAFFRRRTAGESGEAEADTDSDE